MEREEGELTDEDLEDVSDNSSELSIPIALTGKSPLREPFRELSLTSISDDDTADSLLLEKTTYRHITRNLYRNNNNNNKHSHKHRHDDDDTPPPTSSTKRARRFSEKRNNSNNNKRRNTNIHNSSRRDYSSLSSSSSDDTSNTNYKNKTILRQLRDAVRINRSQIVPNCSLRTRLKRMIEPPSSQTSTNSSAAEEDDDDDNNLEILRDQALQSKIKSDQNAKETSDNSVNDEDIAQLRLIALKSAVIKKHAERRKRKEEQLKLQQQQLEQQQEQIIEEKQLENPENVPKQTINNVVEVEEKNKSIVEEDEDILRAMLLTSISKKIADKKVNSLPNNNSNKPKANNNNYKLTAAAPINRFIIKVNSDTESDSEQDKKKQQQIVNKQQAPKSDIFDKSLSLFLQQARAKTEQDKLKHQKSSDISHLPRSQQIEYKRLKRKLQILSTRTNNNNNNINNIINNKIMKKISGNENKKFPNINTNKFVVANNAQAQAKTKTVVTATATTAVTTATTAVTTATTTTTAKARIKDDRLLIKGKYEELTPLMGRVSEARNARDRTQAEVKRLINNLKIARAQLTANHQEYTVLVQQLVKAKTDIDKRAEIEEKKTQHYKMCTSTPIKQLLPTNNVVNVVNNVAEATVAINDEIQIQDMDIVETPEPQLPEPDPEPEAEPEPELELELEKNDDIQVSSVTDEMMDIIETVPEIIPEINIKKEATILKYHSPLEHIQISRKQPLQNPLLELCPYDLLGVCRDADCAYQHCVDIQNTITN